MSIEVRQLPDAVHDLYEAFHDMRQLAATNRLARPGTVMRRASPAAGPCPAPVQPLARGDVAMLAATDTRQRPGRAGRGAGPGAARRGQRRNDNRRRNALAEAVVLPGKPSGE